MATGFDNHKYVLINSLDKLKNIQEITEEENEESRHVLVEHSCEEVREIAELITIEFEKLTKKKKQKLILENSMKSLTLLQKGLKLLAEGDLTGAIICFEEVAKEDVTNVKIWKILGTTYMKNMQVEEAFGALNRGLQLEPNNLDVIMALAENYAQNQDVRKTLTTLLSWLRNHPEYKAVVPIEFDHVNLSDVEFNKSLVHFFIKAAQRRPIDYNYQVQTVLGLILNMNRDYNKADDCFRSALQVRPQNPMLWNQLGITSGKLCKYEEAIDFFNHALSVDPHFLCAKYNIGLLCLSKKEFREAAEHFLSILNRQACGQTDNTFMNYTSTTTWNLLHRCTANMIRPDLQKVVLERDLKTLNKEFGIS